MQYRDIAMNSHTNEPPPKGKISSLRYLMRYLIPYRKQAAGATVALVFTASGVPRMFASWSDHRSIPAGRSRTLDLLAPVDQHVPMQH